VATARLCATSLRPVLRRYSIYSMLRRVSDSQAPCLDFHPGVVVFNEADTHLLQVYFAWSQWSQSRLQTFHEMGYTLCSIHQRVYLFTTPLFF
jgi:hypothetical protein